MFHLERQMIHAISSDHRRQRVAFGSTFIYFWLILWGPDADVLEKFLPWTETDNNTFPWLKASNLDEI